MEADVYLSLGSNLADRAANLADAIAGLRTFGRVIAVSDLYETEPVEVADQPWFLNCAIHMATPLTAGELLDRVLGLERKMGRVRTQPKGPRLVDIDILLYGDAVIELPTLTIPHPGMHERRFVLEPLAEIAPEVVHPLLHSTVSELLSALPEAGPAVHRRPRNANVDILRQ